MTGWSWCCCRSATGSPWRASASRPGASQAHERPPGNCPGASVRHAPAGAPAPLPAWVAADAPLRLDLDPLPANLVLDGPVLVDPPGGEPYPLHRDDLLAQDGALFVQDDLLLAFLEAVRPLFPGDRHPLDVVLLVVDVHRLLDRLHVDVAVQPHPPGLEHLLADLQPLLLPDEPLFVGELASRLLPRLGLLGRDREAVVAAELVGLRGGHVLAGVDVRAAHDLLRVERDAKAVPGDLAAAERHEAARLARADASPRGRSVHVVPEYLLDGTYDLSVGARYLRAKEFFGLRCHGDISPRVAITGQVPGIGL